MSDMSDYERENQEFAAKLHRTWVQLLVESGHRELAAAVLDAELEVTRRSFGDDTIVCVDIPSSSYVFIVNDPTFERALKESLTLVTKGRFTDQNGNEIEDPEISFRIKLMEVEDDWKVVVRNLIVNFKDANQGRVSELMASKKGQNIFLYNEMKFASKSEIRIAQEFENRKVLFFPLALAVRADTGVHYKDHREADFLACDDGVWGILEVSFHPDRFETDAEKDAWFKKSGILCVQHYTAERCFKEPSEVVNQFLEILAKHKR
jgi:hypothetical protein